MRRLSVILGIPFDEVTLSQAVERIVGLARQPGRTRQVATANTDFVARALADPELHDILCRADLVTADGMPIVWASRMLGGRLPERVAGADLVPALAGRCAAEDLSIYLLGARPEVAQTAAERLRSRFPGLRVAGVHSPPPADLDAMDHACILQRIDAARPDVLLVAFGNPKQEKWIHRHIGDLQVPVAVGIGGSLDFIAGSTRRAPRWMQRTGTEWVWRLLNEPRRLWRRYAFDLAAFGPHLARYLLVTQPLAAAHRQRAGRGDVWVEDDGAVWVRGWLGAGQRARFEASALRVLGPGRRIEVLLAECRYVDSAGLGCLMALSHRARELGRDVRLVDVPPRVRGLLRSSRLDGYLDSALPSEVLP